MEHDERALYTAGIAVAIPLFLHPVDPAAAVHSDVQSRDAARWGRSDITTSRLQLTLSFYGRFNNDQRHRRGAPTDLLANDGGAWKSVIDN